MFPGEVTHDHWVSRGYQQNFASQDKRVAIICAQTGRTLKSDQPIRSNFRERGFNAFFNMDGSPDSTLERAFAGLERSVLNEIRLIGRTRRGPEQKAAVANLFAIHLVRSPAYRAFHTLVVERNRADVVTPVAGDSRLPSMYEATFGRQADDGDLLNLVNEQLDDLQARRFLLIQSMGRQHDLMAEKLNRYRMQVFEIPPHLPGLALADVPVVHLQIQSGRHGFRDELALGDANLIMAPLSRRVGVCFTAARRHDVTIKTRRMVDLINAVFLRAAIAEVACHPDDALAMSQTHRRLDRLPVARLVDPT